MDWEAIGKWSVKLVLAVILLWLGWGWLRNLDEVYQGNSDPNLILSYFFRILGLGGLLIAIFFFDIVGGVGNRMVNFIFSNSGSVELRPEYSIAEARAREGKYEEAIAEFRKVWQKFPNDVNAHLRIAEILCTHFQRYDEAVAEMRAALEKKSKPDTWAFLANRLADIQAEYQHDFVAARETLQQILLKLPNTKYAEAAGARGRALDEREAHLKSGERPRLKIRGSQEEANG